jgi:hypothetical protein
MGPTWRDLARPIIAKVIAEVGTSDRKRLKAALREAYPWGPREYHPYKIWCNEIRVQLGEVEKPERKKRAKKPAAKPAEQQGQTMLF